MSISVESAAVARTPSQNAASPIDDYCRTVLAHLGLGSREKAHCIQTLGLTSCSRGEGVSTVAAHLAAAAASTLDRPVVLVDCNLADPSVHRTFDVPIGAGLRDALWETTPIREFLQASAVPNLSLLTAGRPKHGAGLAFGSPNLVRLFSELHEEFGLVIVDLPAFTHGVPAGVGGLLDGLLMVIEAEKVRWEVAQHTAVSLAGAGVKLLGVVMNKRRYYVPGWLYETL